MRRTLRHVPARSGAGLIALGAALVASLGATACGNFDITNPNSPSVDDLIRDPSRSRLAAAATGLFAGARGDAQGLIWILGSMGREGAKLDGNNQPDYQEPFYGPMSPGGVGGAFWAGRFATIRSANVYLQALDEATALSDGEIAASRGMAKAMKALAMLQVIITRGALGAPVDVDRPLTDTAKAPFVSQDSVYGYIVNQLDSAYAELTAAGGAAFPFDVPPGFQGNVGGLDLSTPSAFREYVRALKAKALVLRGSLGCGDPCFTAALAALGESFLDPNGDLRAGAYFDFSTRSGDVVNRLSDPLGGTTFFALNDVLSAEAQQQPGGAPDQRLLDKLVAATDTQRLSGFPVVGDTKFSIYLGPGGAADPSASIPIIRNEELLLLRAEAEIGVGDRSAALADLNLIRSRSGQLGPAALTAGSSTDDFITELLYNRRFSLLWEQGTSWIDARRYNRLDTLPVIVDGGAVPTIFPVPSQECASRGLPVPCSPLGGG